MAYQKLQVSRAVNITTNDAINIANPGGGQTEACVLYVGNGGNLHVLTAGGDDITLNNVLSGTFIPIQVIRVFSTGTTAGNIIALW